MISHITPSYLSLIEDEQRIPNVEVLAQIAKVADVSIDYLIYGTDKNKTTALLLPNLNLLEAIHIFSLFHSSYYTTPIHHCIYYQITFYAKIYQIPFLTSPAAVKKIPVFGLISVFF